MILPTELFVRQYDELVKGLAARDEFEILKVGAIHRQLLLDALVHEANRAHRIPLRFTINDVGSIEDVPVRPEILFHGYSLDPTTLKTSAGTLDLTLDQFLKRAIIEANDVTISVKDIIKFAANKAGGVHYDQSRTAEEALRGEVIAQLNSLGMEPLSIALQTINRIVLVTLKPLREAIVHLPPELPLFAHYRLNPGESIQFNGRGQFLEANFNHEMKHGWSWNGVVRVTRQIETGKRYIYELGNLDGSLPRFALAITEDGELVAEADVDSQASMNIKTSNFIQSLLFDKFIYVNSEICIGSDYAQLRLSLNNRLISEEKVQVEKPPSMVTRQTIGSSLSGANSAAFEIREIVIVEKCLTSDERKELAKYFWLQWHD